ncbi:hypothetical protein V5P93_004281 [Actinokineospora auranticolor]|uniref:hypothetical protein n=1 Tax=Actinokineospora auranticolor TaxID=155976 RepID=UPI000CEC90A9|nr:hypothetical protein [Actinokineospora auranticolor]
MPHRCGRWRCRAAAAVYHQCHPPTRLDPDRAPELVRNATTFRRGHGHWPVRGWLHDLHLQGLV